MLVLHDRVGSWLIPTLETLPVSREVRAYTVSTLERFAIDPGGDMSRESIVLAYAGAASFPDFQRIGDWILFRASLYPTPEDPAAITFGRLAYARCYSLVRSWRVYDELADGLPQITGAVAASIRASGVNPVVERSDGKDTRPHGQPVANPRIRG